MRAAINILGSSGAIINASIAGILTTEHPATGRYVVRGSLGLVPVVEGGWGYVVNQLDSACAVSVTYAGEALTVDVTKSGVPFDLLHSITLHILVPDDAVPSDNPAPDQPIVLDQVAIKRAGVDTERDRRIDAGFAFGGVVFQSRPTDRENIAGAAQLAFMAVVGGAQPGDLRWASETVDYQWITADNSIVTMDAATVVDFGRAAAAEKQSLIFAARTLKDMNPIPEDFRDDKWWP